MPDSTLANILINAGVAGVFIILFLTGLVFPRSVVDDLRTERDAARQEALAERERGDAAVAAAQASRDVFAAIQAGMGIATPISRPRVHDPGPGD
jgi:hypothetical protein